jgi:hypothetical protein
VAQEVLWDEALRTLGSAARPVGVEELLVKLFAHVYDFYRAPVTRYFQHLVLGRMAVTQAYGIEPEIDTTSYLERYDQSLLGEAVRDELDRCYDDGRICLALYTARPSLPPVDEAGSTVGFPPEAELARALVGLGRYPVIGLGKLQWLAERADGDVGRLVKPSPVQALAAIGVAVVGDEAPSLLAALALWQEGMLQSPLADLDRVTVHVFEDRTGGIVAVEQAATLLRNAGIDTDVRAYGIVALDGPKAAAMATYAIPQYTSVDEAVQAALAWIE